MDMCAIVRNAYEYMEGGSLDTRLALHLHHGASTGTKGVPLTSVDRLRIARDVLDGLAYLHGTSIYSNSERT
jgi:serine/threonine protein kinase